MVPVLFRNRNNSKQAFCQLGFHLHPWEMSMKYAIIVYCRFGKNTFWSSKDLDDHSACHAHVWPLDMWVVFWEYSQSLKSLITNIHKQDLVGWYRLLEMDHVTCPCFANKKSLVWHLWWYVANALDSIRFGLPINTLEDDEKKLEVSCWGENLENPLLVDWYNWLFGDEARKLWDKNQQFF